MQNSVSALTDGCEFWMLISDLGLMEERDEGLVGGLDQHELKGIAIEGHALKRGDDR